MTAQDLTDLSGIGEIHALLGRGTEYEGKLTFEGRVRIDGIFRGQIFSDGVLILGDGADVQGTLEVGTLIVRGGVLKGDVKATKLVEIHAPGRVQSDIDTPQLFIDKGVVFEGRCVMPDAQVHDLPETEDPEQDPERQDAEPV
ncbi:MAG: bactofilin family protein [Myxococcota bacterium]